MDELRYAVSETKTSNKRVPKANLWIYNILKLLNLRNETCNKSSGIF